jgi:hypothetical protein
MNIDEFIKLALAQPPFSKHRLISIPGPELEARLQSGQPISIAEIHNHPDQTYEVRNYTYGHILDAGAQREEISQWQLKHPSLHLPDDVKVMLERINGIHLWADFDEKRSYFGILPLAQWGDIATWEWSSLFEKPPSGKVVMSYHENGDFYLLLDTEGGKYYWYDTEDIDRPTFIGSSVEELLSWWWNKSQELDPQKESG